MRFLKNFNTATEGCKGKKVNNCFRPDKNILISDMCLVVSQQAAAQHFVNTRSEAFTAFVVL